MNTDSYWSWFRQESEREEFERAAFSGETVALLDKPEIELEPPVPTGFESFWV
jgi:hypothetical protein